MAQSIEDIVGKLERERAVPGTRPGEEQRVRYVSFKHEEDGGKAYQQVIRKVEPPLMKSGGVMRDGCIITVPDGTRFFPLVLNGDIEGWQKQIEQGARELGLLTACIKSGALVLTNGNSYPLADCSIEFD